MNKYETFYNKIRNLEDITVDFVGDSITYGLNHCFVDETYVAVFARLFAEKFTEYSVIRYDGKTEGALEPIKTFDKTVVEDKGRATASFIKNGVGGNTVKRALNRKENFMGKMPNGEYPDLTVFMFGINDALTNDASKFVTPDVFYEHYKELIELMFSKSPSAIMDAIDAEYALLVMEITAYIIQLATNRIMLAWRLSVICFILLSP
jgi:hypothetical protein